MIGIAAPAEFVGFIFAYVRKQPRTPEELRQTTALLAQQHVIRIWADNQNRKPVRIQIG